MSLSTTDQARADLAAAFRLAARFDLHEGIDNHFSYALDDGTFLVNRWGVHWSKMTAGDILQVDGGGTVRRGRGTVERTALAIHSEVHVACPPARAILHTHMTYTTALACTNGRIEDLRAAAKIVEGHKVAESVNAMVVPGSGLVKQQAETEGLDAIFKAAGFDWREPGCSMCLAMNPDKLSPGERCASTSNRNFEGRQGYKGRTHLVSPIMAAAAAIAGRFVDVREWR